MVGAFRQSRPVDRGWLLEYFTAGTASYDDLLALACLEQGYSGSDDDLIRACVQRAVTDTGSYPLAATRRRFDRSLRALRGWRWCSLKIPRRQLWTPQITVTRGPVASLPWRGHRRSSSPGCVCSTRCGRDGRLPVAPFNLLTHGSWPVDIEAGSARDHTAPPGLVAMWTTSGHVPGIDWASVLTTNESGYPPSSTSRCAPARPKTDLSFIFERQSDEPLAVLMDQVTHITFSTTCDDARLEYYIEDLA